MFEHASARIGKKAVEMGPSVPLDELDGKISNSQNSGRTPAILYPTLKYPSWARREMPRSANSTSPLIGTFVLSPVSHIVMSDHNPSGVALYSKKAETREYELSVTMFPATSVSCTIGCTMKGAPRYIPSGH